MKTKKLEYCLDQNLYLFYNFIQTNELNEIDPLIHLISFDILNLILKLFK